MGLRSHRTADETSGTTPPSAEALALAAYVAVLVVAVPVILYTNRSQWFFLDEWDFLAGRHLSSVNDLLRPHNEHWSTLPIVIYRVLFRFVGLNHYWPYQVPVLAAHLSVATLLRIVMRRAGVGAWLATASATLFVFLGSGRTDIAWGFQIGFTGAVAFGLAHLLLADHDGPLNRRDLLGLLCGLAALMCSGIGVVMVIVVATATLIRRGPRPALLHAGPLAAIFLLWYVTYGHKTGLDTSPTASQFLTFNANLAKATLLGMGQFEVVAVLLGVLLAVGLGTMASQWRADLRARYAAVLGLLTGAVALAAITAWGRSFLVQLGADPIADRYVHLSTALVLATIAVGAAKITHRWRWSLVPLLVVLLAGVPRNIEALTVRGVLRVTLGSPEQLVALARVAVATNPPRSLQPRPDALTEVTAGWLIDASRDGRIPSVSSIDPTQLDVARVRLSLEQLDLPPRRSCRTVDLRSVRLNSGDTLVVPAAQAMVALRLPDRLGPPVTYAVGSSLGLKAEQLPADVRLTLRAVAPLRLSVRAEGTRGRPSTVCR